MAQEHFLICCFGESILAVYMALNGVPILSGSGFGIGVDIVGVLAARALEMRLVDFDSFFRFANYLCNIGIVRILRFLYKSSIMCCMAVPLAV